MSPDKQKQLKVKYPSLLENFNDKENQIWCEDGWFSLIDDCLYLINQYAESKKQDGEVFNVKIFQIKEKLAKLRVYVKINNIGGSRDYINGIISMACEQSKKLCEICGTNQEIGRTTKDRIQTLCLPHALELNRINDWSSLEVLKEGLLKT